MTTIGGFEIRTDLSYDLTNHLWVEPRGDGVRVGMDPLGVETSGTLAQVALAEAGTRVVRGEPVGSLEAEKFVGPVIAAVSGVITATNANVLSNPGLIEQDPYGAGWLYELGDTVAEERAALLSGDQDVAQAFAKKVAHYRLEGVLAE